MRHIILPLLFTVVVIVSFFVGVFSQAPELMLVWLCLHPFAWFWLGRASLGLLRNRRVAVLSERDIEMLSRARGVR